MDVVCSKWEQQERKRERGRGPMETLFRHLSRGTRKPMKHSVKRSDCWTDIRTKRLPNVNVEGYRYTVLLGTRFSRRTLNVIYISAPPNSYLQPQLQTLVRSPAISHDHILLYSSFTRTSFDCF